MNESIVSKQEYSYVKVKLESEYIPDQRAWRWLAPRNLGTI
jgi:hypothetical protein